MFFSFFHNYNFLVWKGFKRAKTGPKWQKILSFELHIWGTVHHMIVICVTQVWNDVISRQFLYFFKILIFRLLAGGRAKYGPKWQNIMSVSLRISGTVPHMIMVFGTHLQNDDISSIFFFFFHFFKILMNEKKTYNYQFQFVTLYISGTVNHIIKIFGTQV